MLLKIEPRRSRQSLGIAYTEVILAWFSLAQAVPVAQGMGSSLSNGEMQGGSPGGVSQL